MGYINFAVVCIDNKIEIYGVIPKCLGDEFDKNIKEGVLNKEDITKYKFEEYIKKEIK